MPIDLQQCIARFDRNSYHPKLNITDNLLFGRVVATEPAAEKRIEAIISETLTDLETKRGVMLQLTQSQVGISGRRLAEAPRHTITLARMLTKRPQVMVFHDALSPLDHALRRTIRRNLRKLMPKSTLIWIDREIDNFMEFDKVYQFTEEGSLTNVTVAAPASSEKSSHSISLIGQSPIFGSLSAAQQQLLSEYSHRVTTEAGEFVFNSGNPSRNAYIIIKGNATSLRDANDPESVTGKPGPGETIGVVEIMAQRQRILSVKAETDLELLRIDGSKIQEVIESDPVVIQSMLRAITDQWAAASQR
jgi:ABC-type Fe3+/spermidine/putrescine transport system ATPase subunit